MQPGLSVMASSCPTKVGSHEHTVADAVKQSGVQNRRRGAGAVRGGRARTPSVVQELQGVADHRFRLCRNCRVLRIIGAQSTPGPKS